MLEYALKQERAKFHKLKYGVDLQQGDMKPPALDEPGADSQMDTDPSNTSISNATWRERRQLLRKYLQEISYTDRIIDIRSTRVRALLGLNNNAEQEENLNGGPVNGNESNKRANETQGCISEIEDILMSHFSVVDRPKDTSKKGAASFPCGSDDVRYGSRHSKFGFFLHHRRGHGG